MSDNKNAEKTLEAKVRPYPNPNSQERPDQRGVSRVLLSRDALLHLGLDSGHICYLWRIGEQSQHSRIKAIAWLTSEKSMSKKVIQISKAFQDLYGFKLGEDLNICAGGSLDVVETVLLRDITVLDEKNPKLETSELPYWEWYLAFYSLNRAVEIFTGLTFKDVPCGDQKRSFRVENVNGTGGLAKFNLKSSSVKVTCQDETIVLQKTPLALFDIAGIDQALEKLNDFLGDFNEQFEPPFGQPSCGVLLQGGHGTGKSYIAEKLIGTGWGKAYHINSRAKPATIVETFKNAKLCQPSIIVIDKLESLVSKNNALSEENVEVLGRELDNLILEHHGEGKPQVLLLATTLNLSDIPQSLKGERRFYTQISLPIPDAAARKQILGSLNPRIHPDRRKEVLDKLGDRTHAYTAWDLRSLFIMAGMKLKKRVGRPALRSPDAFIEEEDIEQALLEVRPTAMHDISLKPRSVKWKEIGGQDNVKNALRIAVETPIKQPDLMAECGLTATKGVLLYGPPGCSKTLCAQAMATEVGFNFFAVKGAELLNMYVGESERAVREIFARARAASPSIIFFDEIESIGSKRESGGRNSGVNVLTTLLNEMDGIEALKGVMVLAATNQPQALDLALLRPGRFDELIYVAPPDLAGREEILRVRTGAMKLADDVDITLLAKMTDGYSGAETVHICQKAGNYVLQRHLTSGESSRAEMEDFKKAVDNVKKQITEDLVLGYKNWAAGIKGDTD